jgi:hypothetical protein
MLLLLASSAFSQAVHAAGAFIDSTASRTVQPHPLPSTLAGVITQEAYDKWLSGKVLDLFWKDNRRHMPYAKPGGEDLYREKIGEALAENALIDPFTGDKLDWSLISKWPPPPGGDKLKEFDLLPTVDHKDPCSPTLDFEICSRKTNLSKSCLTPTEFVALCKKIFDHQGSDVTAAPSVRSGYGRSPALYFLPPFLKEVITLEKFKKWLDRKAHHLFESDKKIGRPYALHGSQANYKMAIYNAVVVAGPCDPYTGKTMDWTLIRAWEQIDKDDEPGTYKKKYLLLPVVDHTNPDKDTLEFEICSWIVNDCKSNMDRDEFLAFCKRVVAYR